MEYQINTTYLERCLLTLSKAYELLIQTNEESIEYDLYRSACIKEFEILLEQSSKLLKKILRSYAHSPKEIDKLNFKDLFRHAALHDLITEEECERWLKYRDNRNNTSHDYGIHFAMETLKLLEQFIMDTQKMLKIIKDYNSTI